MTVDAACGSLTKSRIIHRAGDCHAGRGDPPASVTTQDMIPRMATPSLKAAAGSVGTVATQFIDLPNPLRLHFWRELSSMRIAYEPYGTLSPARDNVILVCPALSGDAHAAGFSA